ncbi:hypothetical protein FA13DRAFT_283888 [Coprinellus micaceus]|uniref:Secreted protein n=1 Tax=Coprinellus micaceus TaxID=71717 RepID=A0A4Y7TDP8_COPMI|nr:hypothetical protein FA13DRAFT_283888 [Coprinellus micaceus]
MRRSFMSVRHSLFLLSFCHVLFHFELSYLACPLGFIRFDIHLRCLTGRQLGFRDHRSRTQAPVFPRLLPLPIGVVHRGSGRSGVLVDQVSGL